MVIYPAAYAVSSTSKSTLDSSSSGGVFFELAHYYICTLKGVVYGAALENGVVFHKKIFREIDIPQLQKSKYVHSNLKNTFHECLSDLTKGLHVLFVGTPCQINSLVNYLKYKNAYLDKLLTLDLFCHGVPQEKFWKQYIKEANLSSATNIDFRYKHPSWEHYSFAYSMKKGISKRTLFEKNAYCSAFLKNYTLMSTCYTCEFKKENRLSNASLGDFWGVKSFYPEFYNKNGTSLLIIRNKNEQILKILSKKSNVNKVSYSISTYLNKAYSFPAKKPDDYAFKLSECQNDNFIKTFSANKTSIRNKLQICLIKICKTLFQKTRRTKKINNIDTLIITDSGHTNFGNRLQNFALRKLIEDHNHTVGNLYLDLSLRNHFLVSFLLNLKRLSDTKRKRLIYKASIKSGETNFRFDYSKKCKNSLSKIKNIVVGSDQVWNWQYQTNKIPFNLAILCSQEKMNKISYAASITANYISEEYKPIFIEGLSNFSAISVREKNGKELIENLGYECELVADPTLLLSPEEWRNEYNKYSMKKGKEDHYIFKYCLKTNGNIPSKYNSYKLIDILDKKSIYYKSNQFDFIKYIDNAELIITDSFHAVVFSFLFKKKVLLLERADMSSRLASFLSIVNIKYAPNTIIDFSIINEAAIQKLIKKSKEFLNKNLK